MKRILKGPYTKFVSECLRCGCEFEYDFEDIFTHPMDASLEVVCPSCCYVTRHDYFEGRYRKDLDAKEERSNV